MQAQRQQGYDLGGTVRLTRPPRWMPMLTTIVFHYNAELTSNESDNTQGLGGTLRLNQIMSDRLKFSAEASNRAVYKHLWFRFSVMPLIYARDRYASGSIDPTFGLE